MSVEVRRVPVEVKVVVALLVGVALVYLALAGVMVASTAADARTLLMPATGLLLGGLVAGGIMLRNAFARMAGFVVVVLFAVLHAFFLLAAALLWVKLFSLLAAAGYVYAGVLLNSRPLRRYVLGDRA
ncbi:hypothetical protein SAMN05421810_106264 [Amycolatopsis arida]|uniref:Uncharacterized protein n=1 Tax=Amycolatopsis arida TaxID=587909 RepID=A0A1I5XUW8_9PSEU|nr:hypothetical protein [Amycolatopsis arida]TDX97255.1 hypothetical protein CLV69_102358 [Amycolatopsis arida]SFQ35666.1 hypothetical protein SAMN05421810_106264 [Amycolatopsis arida]